MKYNRYYSLALICFIIGVMMTWQYKSIANNKKNSDISNIQYDSLVEQYGKERKNNENLQKRRQELEQELADLKSAQGNIKKFEENIRKQILRATTIAGGNDVTGEGVIVTLDNGTEEMISDIDILEVINTLRAGEAQAISINDERIVAMTAIIMKDNSMIVNDRSIYAPYEIKAIADPQKLENSLNMVGGVVDFVRLFDKHISVEKKDNILIKGLPR